MQKDIKQLAAEVAELAAKLNELLQNEPTPAPKIDDELAALDWQIFINNKRAQDEAEDKAAEHSAAFWEYFFNS